MRFDYVHTFTFRCVVRPIDHFIPFSKIMPVLCYASIRRYAHVPKSCFQVALCLMLMLFKCRYS